MRTAIRRLVVLLSSILLFQAFLCAQSSTTSLRGTVTDGSGAAVVGATVTLNSPGKGTSRTSLSNAQGGYEFLALPPGAYDLAIEAHGFKRQEQKNIQLLVDTPATVNAKLEIGTISETVEVSGEATAVNTTDATLGNAFGERQVKELPLEGRNVPDLLSLQAGVAYTGNRADVDRDVDTRSGAVNGARSDQSNITLDGVDVNDQVNGSAFTSVLPVTLDSVQEFRVTTTNANADQGRSSGAQVSLVTKSGTNEFHGSLYEYHRNTITSANDYFVKVAELQSGEANKPPKLIRNIFGGSLGGPLVKNRLYFFVNYEGYRQREENSVLRIVPSDSLRQGNMRYICDSSDPNCSTNNPDINVANDPSLGLVATLTPGNIQNTLDPLHLGDNPVMLNYFNSFPEPNDLTQGDKLNFVGYRFRGAVPTNNNWYIARADYKLNASGSHTLFWRGALRNDTHSSVPYLPGTEPLTTNANYSKGFALGYTAVLRPSLINSFRWGYTRQSIGAIGNNDSDAFIYFRGLNDNSTSNSSSLAVTRSYAYQTPVNNFTDDLSWTKGRHTIQSGTNIRFIRNPRQNYLSSFSSASTNSSGLNTAGIAGTNSPLDPGNHSADGFPAVDPSYVTGYNYPLIAMLGIVSEVDATFNFDKSGTALPEGAPLTRRFAADEYEFYVQDTFRAKPNLTITYGLRYSLFSPPWETNGTEVTPTTNLGQWFHDRANKMLTGGTSNTDPLLTFDLAGPANHRPGYYNWDYKDFAPRLAFAYTPNSGKSVFRGGFGVVFDRVGAGLLNTFDSRGSFGLSTSITNDTIPSATSAPRLTGLNTLPQLDQNGAPFYPATPTGGFPYTYPDAGTGLAIQWGLDNTIKTPYSYTVDFSFGHELTRDYSLEISYVGRFSHRLLTQEDLAMPLNIVDPQSKISYFQAARRLSELGFAGTPTSEVTSASVGDTAAYWQNIVQPLQPGDAYTLACSGGTTTDVTQAMYDLFGCGGGPVFGFGDETTPLANLDYWGSDFSGNAGILGESGNYYGPRTGANSFFNRQFHSLYAWRSIGNANYNAMQVNLRKRMSQGLQFDFNYTWSKSIDISSDAERIDAWGGLGGQIINSWDPNALRGVSDFDTTHQFNMNWVFELPFGQGKPLAGGAHGLLQGIIGGWQLSGLARWTSGFPVYIANGATWPTNWQLGGAVVQVGPIHAKTTIRSDGSVNLFPENLPTTDQGLGPFRHLLPGESGQRNIVRGPGYAGLDMGLSKRWKIGDKQGVSFRWEVFNVPNLKRFDVQTITNSIDAGPTFGTYSGLLTNPRVMQFALRYEF
ncbi:MAG: carboxypeptidase regulatory-like domain-containing protein [Acidobacteria bacterium]|nr:carboxypeptidase regulatory-like domain-containing protein [Acidobacteriota bacterium]